MMEDEKLKNALKEKLLGAMTQVISNDPLYLEDQLQVLPSAFYDMIYSMADMAGYDPQAYICDVLNLLHEYNGDLPLPSTAMEDVKNHWSADEEEETVQIVSSRRLTIEKMNSEKNSWLNVFHSPMSHEEVRQLLSEAKHDDGKHYGVLLTSMDDAAKREIKELMVAAGLHAVSGANQKKMRYVVFGNGKLASTKTQVIADRMKYEDIRGIYYRTMLDVLRTDERVSLLVLDDRRKELARWDRE